jgi:hypothetical protein
MGNFLAERLESENTKDDTFRLKHIQMGETQGICLGKLISVEKPGRALVDYPDNPFGPLAARSTVKTLNRDGNTEVFLMFENGNPRLPIIIGVVQDQPLVTAPPQEVILDKKETKDIILDGERIVFDAKKEIVLRCGEGSVTIRRDGKIVIKGTSLLSRSKGVNKIKGTAVNIN